MQPRRRVYFLKEALYDLVMWDQVVILVSYLKTKLSSCMVLSQIYSERESKFIALDVINHMFLKLEEIS